MNHGQTTATKTKPKRLSEITLKYNFIHLRAMPSNTGIVFVGGHEVSDKTGYPLLPGDEMLIQDEHIDRVFIISQGKGDGVAWYC